MGQTEDQLRDDVLRTVASVLGCPVDEGTNLTRESEPAWDSLKHVELLFTLEDTFDVRFDEDELAVLNSTDAIAKSLVRHREEG